MRKIRTVLGPAACVFSLFTSPLYALNLEEAHKLALDSDPELQAAQAQLQAALEAVPQSRAALLPNINGQLYLSHSRREINSNDTITNDSTGYGLSLAQSVYNHAYHLQLDQSDLSAAQAAVQYDAVEQTLIIRVSEAYFNVLAARDNLRFALAEKESIARQLEQTQKRFEVGLIAITDVKEAQASYDLAVSREINAENQVATSREALQVLIGRYPEQLKQLAKEIPLASPDPEDIQQWAETAQAQNLGLKAARYSVDIAATQVKTARAGHYPSLDLTARYSVDNDSSFGATSFDSTSSSVGLQLNVPIYSGGLTTSQTRQAAHLHDQAKANLDRQLRLTTQQTRSAYLTVVAALSQVNALKQALISTQTAAEATQAGFEVGTRTAVEVLASLREQYRAERDYAQARYDYILNMLRLKQAAGTLAPEDITRVNQWLAQS